MPLPTPPPTSRRPAIHPPQLLASLEALSFPRQDARSLFAPLRQDPAGIWQLLALPTLGTGSARSATGTLVQRLNQLQQLPPTEQYRWLRQLLLAQLPRLGEARAQSQPSSHWTRFIQVHSAWTSYEQAGLGLDEETGEEIRLALSVACLAEFHPAAGAGKRQPREKRTRPPAPNPFQPYAAQLRLWAPDSLAGEMLHFLEGTPPEIRTLPEAVRQAAFIWQLAWSDPQRDARDDSADSSAGEPPADLTTLGASLGLDNDRVKNLQRQTRSLLDRAREQSDRALSGTDFSALRQELELLQQLRPPLSTDQRTPLESLGDQLRDQLDGPFLLLQVQGTQLDAVAGRDRERALPAPLLRQLRYPWQNDPSLPGKAPLPDNTSLARSIEKCQPQLDTEDLASGSAAQLRRLLGLNALLYIPVPDVDPAPGVQSCQAVILCEPGSETLNPLRHARLLSRNLGLHLQEQARQRNRRLQTLSTHQSAVEDFARTLREDLADPLSVGHNYLHLLEHQHRQEAGVQAAVAALSQALGDIEERLRHPDQPEPDIRPAPDLSTLINLIMADIADHQEHSQHCRIDFLPSSRPCPVDTNTARLQCQLKALIALFADQPLRLETHARVQGEAVPQVEFSLQADARTTSNPIAPELESRLRELGAHFAAQGGRLWWRTTASGDLRCTLLLKSSNTRDERAP